MNAFPVRMRDRWSSRIEPAAGHGVVYWHILMNMYPEARAAAADAQRLLARFPGLHLTPPEWLHITTAIVGSTDDITRDQMAAMVEEAQHLARDVAPTSVSIQKILYHPEAIILSVQTAEALWPIRRIAQAVTQNVDERAETFCEPHPWTPHMTIAYSTANQEVEPIVSVLGRSVQERLITVESLTLVIQWGPERLWNWEPVGTVQLGQAGSHT